MATKRGAPGGLHYAILTTILAIAAGVRLVNANSEPLWGDEGLTLVLVNWPLRDLMFKPVDPTPALYYALHKLLAIPADASPALIRSISIACGTAATAMMYVLGRLTFGARAGLLAATLLALWPPLVDYSQEARAYMLLLLLTLSSAASLLWWSQLRNEDARSRHILSLSLFVLTTALSFHAHLTAIFWILVAFPLFLVAGLRRPRRIGAVLAATAALILLAVPGLIRLVRQFEAGTNFNWLRQASATEFIEKSANVLLPFEHWWVQVGVLALGTGLFLWARRKARERSSGSDDDFRQLLILAFLILPVLIWAAGFSIRPIFMERTILFAVPGVVLLLVALIEAVPNRRIGNAAGLFVAVLLGHTLLTQGTIRPREDWDGVYAYLQRHVRSGDVVLLCAYQYASLRHAAVSPMPAPLVYTAGGPPTMLEERLGTRPDWDRLSFRYDIVPFTQKVPRRALMEERSITMTGGTAWLVEVDCPKQGRAKLVAPLGIPTWRLVWSSEETPVRPRINVARTEVRSPVTFRVLSPRELRTERPVR